MIRRLVIRLTARGFRKGMPEDEMRDALRRAFPHRTVAWRTEIVEAAQARNRSKLMAA